MINLAPVLIILFNAISTSFRENLFYKAAALFLSLGLWIVYGLSATSFVAMTSVFILMMNLHGKRKSLFGELDLINLTVLSVAPFHWMFLVLALILAIDAVKIDKNKFLTLLLTVGIGVTLKEEWLNPTHLAVAAAMAYALMAVVSTARHRYQTALVFGVVFYRSVIFTPDLARFIFIGALILILAILMIHIWSEDNQKKIIQKIHQISIISTLISAAIFGAFGFWAMLASWLCYFIILENDSETTKLLNVDMPWVALSSLVLLPTSPVFIYNMAGKVGVEVVMGAITASLLMLVGWRHIKVLESGGGAFVISGRVIVATMLYLSIGGYGTHQLLHNNLHGLFISLALSLLAIVLFVVLNLDQKIFANRLRSTLALKLNYTTSAEAPMPSLGWSIDLWQPLADIVAFALQMLEAALSFVRRTILFWSIALIVLFILLGGSNA